MVEKLYVPPDGVSDAVVRLKIVSSTIDKPLTPSLPSIFTGVCHV